MMRILVSGAGIGGLAFVNALKHFDCTIDIVEKSPEFRPLGVGIVLHPNGMGALAALGLSRAVSEAGAELRWLELVRNENVLRLALPDIWSGASYPTVAIVRHDLHHILARGVLSDRKVRLRMDARIDTVAAVEQRPIVRFDDGTEAEYDLVVGSDGIHSGVRQILWPDLTPVATGLVYIRFPARNTIGLPDDTWRTYESETVSFGFIPVAPRRLHCFYQLRVPKVPFQAGDEEAFLQSQGHSNSRELQCAIVGRCGAYHAGMAYMLRPTAWGRGACALLGDAAHAVPPTLSEGGGLALEDALVLAQVLRDAATIPQAIKDYEFYRRDRVLWMYRMGLSQVNALRRGRVGGQLDPAVASRHAREMYAPLRAPFLPESTMHSGPVRE